jgi:photosystem II stability/assembly factor-like uncharacterized protein
VPPEVDIVEEQQTETLKWESLGPLNFNGRIRALALHPADSDRLYAGASNGGVWETQDAGVTWQPLMDDFDFPFTSDVDYPSIGALAVHLTDPTDPAGPVTIYAGTGEPVERIQVTYPGIGVVKSVDTGVNWAPTAPLPTVSGHPPRGIAAIIVDPTTPQTVYVAAFRGGLFKSIDGGTNWTRQLDGDFRGLAMDPLDAQVLYAGQSNMGVWKTTDGGANWSLLAGVGLPTPAGTPTVVNVAVAASAQQNAVYVKLGNRVYCSIDGAPFADRGDHGQSHVQGWCSYLAVHPTTPGTVYAAGLALERSDDFGAAVWAFKNGVVGGSTEKNRLHDDQHALVVDPANAGIVYAANDGGVYRSEDRGDTWDKCSDGLVVSEFYEIGVDPGGSGLLGGGTQDGGVLETTVGQLYWTFLLAGDGGVYLVDPANPAIRYYERDRLLISKRVNALQSGVTNGIDIIHDTLPWIGAIALDPSAVLNVINTRVLYTGTTRVYKTTNGAGQWQPVSNHLGAVISAIAVAPSDPQVVYVGTQAGAIFKTVNGGNAPADWTPCTPPPPARWITRLAVDPSDAKIVYVTFSGFDGQGAGPGHVFRSSNGGVAWSRIDDAGVNAPASTRLPDIPVNGIVIDAKSPQTLYVATDVGVFRTPDLGATWEPFDEGLPNCVVTSVILDPGGTALYAATFGRGAYKRPLV